jgi:hypothetical protein
VTLLFSAKIDVENEALTREKILKIQKSHNLSGQALKGRSSTGFGLQQLRNRY